MKNYSSVGQLRKWAEVKHNVKVEVCAFGGYDISHKEDPHTVVFARTIDDIMPKVLKLSDPERHEY